MQKNITALDIHHLLKEMSKLKDSKVDKIYSPKKRTLLFQLYSRELGKKILRIKVPAYMFMTEYKQDQPLRPSGFCLFLRKRLDNSILEEMNQFEFERIVELVFRARKEKYRLVLELFSKGNIILCRHDYTIVFPMESQEWSERCVEEGNVYKYPHKDFNFRQIKENKLKEMMQETDMDAVRTFAVTLGLGGVYAEELCSRAEIDKDKKKLDDDEIRRVFVESRKMLEEKSPCVYENKLITPIEMKTWENPEKFDTFNSALNMLLTKRFIKKQKKKRVAKHTEEIEELKNIIEQQKKHLLELENSIKKNTRKGELIFENYTKIKEILDRIDSMDDWEKIKEEISRLPSVRSVNLKQKEINIKI